MERGLSFERHVRWQIDTYGQLDALAGFLSSPRSRQGQGRGTDKKMGQRCSSVQKEDAGVSSTPSGVFDTADRHVYHTGNSA